MKGGSYFPTGATRTSGGRGGGYRVFLSVMFLVVMFGMVEKSDDLLKRNKFR